MTSLSITPSSAISFSPTHKTYLQHCQEELDPTHLSSWHWKSKQWQIASVTTQVAFTVLAIGAIIGTSLYAPLYIPVITLSSFLFFKPIQKGCDILDKWSLQAKARFEQLREISHLQHQLSATTAPQLQQILLQRGIQWFMIPTISTNSQRLETLKPLIARYQFWEDQVQKLERKKQAKMREANELAAENEIDNKDEIYDLRCEALEIEKKSLEAKLKNAFINAVIRRPNYSGTFEDLGTFTLTSGQEQAIGNAVGATSVNDFFAFRNGQIHHISRDEVKRLEINDLGSRLIAGMST